MTEPLEGFVHDLDDVEYHAHSALSSTGARQLLKAPAKFWYERNHTQPYKKAFDVGTLAHSKVLGKGAQAEAYPAEILAVNGAASTKEAKAFAARVRAEGNVPLKQAELDMVNGMAESILAHKAARAVLEQDGDTEVSVFATDPETGVDIRARFDFLPKFGTGRRIAGDVKTLHGDATPSDFAKTVQNHGYHVQDAHYVDTLSFAGEEVDAFAFIVVEKEPPYLSAVFVLEPDFREIGRSRAAKARRLFANGQRTGHWPGYPDEIQLVRTPQFTIYQHIDEENL